MIAIDAKTVAAVDGMRRMTEDALAFFREDMQREEMQTVDLHALGDSVAGELLYLGCDITVTGLERVLAICWPAALRREVRAMCWRTRPPAEDGRRYG